MNPAASPSLHFCARCQQSKPLSEMTTRHGKSLRECLDCLSLRRGRLRPRRQVPEIHLSETQLAYIAGLVDGEGSLIIVRNNSPKRGFYYTGRMEIANTSPCLRDVYLEAGFGHFYTHRARRAHWLPCHIWLFGSHDSRALLPRLMPYLRIKKQRALVLLDFFLITRQGFTNPARLDPLLLPTRRTRQQSLWEEMKRLNAPGPDKQSR